MRKYAFLCAALLLLASFMFVLRDPSRASGQDHMPANANSAVGMFYEALLPYGEWVWTASCGWVWSPYDTPIDWRPYSNGNWVNTEEYGYTFQSDEPWAWATYHYGRWFHDADYGWVWCPTTTWGPAWVAWSTNDNTVGWAPLPPSLPFVEGVGFDTAGIDLFSACPSFGFSFCDIDDFLRPDLDDCLFPVIRNEFCLHGSRLEIGCRFEHDRCFNHFPGERRLRERLGHDIPRFHTREVHSVREWRSGDKNEVRIFKPDQKAVAERRTVYRRAFDEANAGPAVGPRSEASILSRQAQDRSALRERHQSWQGWMNQQHAQELIHPPTGLPQLRLLERQQFEQRSLQSHIQTEARNLHTWHERELLAAPRSMGTSRRFSISSGEVHHFSSGSPGFKGGSFGSHSSGGGHSGGRH